MRPWISTIFGSERSDTPVHRLIDTRYEFSSVGWSGSVQHAMTCSRTIEMSISSAPAFLKREAAFALSRRNRAAMSTSAFTGFVEQKRSATIDHAGGAAIGGRFPFFGIVTIWRRSTRFGQDG